MKDKEKQINYSVLTINEIVHFSQSGEEMLSGIADLLINLGVDSQLVVEILERPNLCYGIGKEVALTIKINEGW